MEELEYACVACGSPTKYKNGKCATCYKKDSYSSSRLSEGEEFIGDFLGFYGIKFKEQVPVVGLMNDSKKYRIADFYLENYGVYIEYNGHYRDRREHYDEKIRVYRSNKIPCIHIYPENLGVLHFILDKRLQQEMIDKNLYSELNRYRRFKFFKGESETFVILIGSLLLVLLISISEKTVFLGINYLLFTVILVQFYKLYAAFLDIYKRNKYPLSKLKE